MLVVESWKDVAITRKDKNNNKMEVSNESKTGNNDKITRNAILFEGKCQRFLAC
jgi:hypothetical protein